MCIAFLATKDSPSKDTLRICFSNNNDGAGFAYAHENKLHVEKGFFTFDDFWKAYKQIPKDTPFLCHFRKTSHGPRDRKNCHPWQIDENHALVHNGILRQHDEKNDKLSDTGRFVNEMLKPMFRVNPCMWQEPWMKILLEEYIGWGNKCAILSNTGEYLILREDQGIWDNGIWYSNDSFRRRGVAAWTNHYVKKNSYNGPRPITLELKQATLEEVDQVLAQYEKNKKNLTPLTREVIIKAKKGFLVSNLKITPYTEKLIEKKRCYICRDHAHPCANCQNKLVNNCEFAE
jgi:hypothetical protein